MFKTDLFRVKSVGNGKVSKKGTTPLKGISHTNPNWEEIKGICTVGGQF